MLVVTRRLLRSLRSARCGAVDIEPPAPMRSALPLLWSLLLVAQAQAQRYAQSLDRAGWRFSLQNSGTSSFEQPWFDDSSWRAVDVPHDFVVESNFSEHTDRGHGYHPYGIGLYRLHFSLVGRDACALGRTATIEFDGVMREAHVWLNGLLLGVHDSGFTPFSFPLGACDALASENVPPAIFELAS